MKKTFIWSAIAWTMTTSGISQAAFSPEVNREWCSELLLMRQHYDVSSWEEKRALEDHAHHLLALGDTHAAHLALETLAQMELPETMSSDKTGMLFLLKKYIVHEDELSELAAIVFLRYYDRVHWTSLHTVQQLRELKYLDRQKAIAAFREAFNERPWRVADVNIQSIRKKQRGLWQVRGEVTVTDQLPFQIGGGPVHLVADLEDENLTWRQIGIGGNDVKERNAYVEFDDLSVQDILKGLVARGHFTVELMVDDPFSNKLNAQIWGRMSHGYIQRLDLKDFLSRRQLE